MTTRCGHRSTTPAAAHRTAAARGMLLRGLVLASALFSAACSVSKGLEPHADFMQERPSATARQVADWVMHSGDNRNMPFAIVDKVQARVHVFDRRGRLRGASPVLVGLARGDDSVPGIGDRELSLIQPGERTTPAGRFIAEPGVNLAGEDIVWIDYDAAVSMHRVRPSNRAERRLQRLASTSPADNRITYGCINLPAAFYDDVLIPTFGNGNAVVYVLPETRSAVAEFGIDKLPPSLVHAASSPAIPARARR